jgi:alkylated DNA repair protein (DNA oxidative demethylase)
MTREYGHRVFIQGCGTEGTADLHKIRIKDGCDHFPGYLDAGEQAALLDDVSKVIAKAPLYRPQMPRSGKPFSVMMTNCGPLGWVSDKAGYRYQAHHPMTGKSWPPIPPRLLDIWATLTGFQKPPEACLVNYYAADARMGMHRDEDEADFSAPILSLSLGDSAIFKVGGLKRGGAAQSVKLDSGDALVMAGSARLLYHGVSRVLGGTSTLLEEGGRINLTLRHVGALTVND